LHCLETMQVLLALQCMLVKNVNNFLIGLQLPLKKSYCANPL
jgi:hypothetical protein